MKGDLHTQIDQTHTATSNNCQNRGGHVPTIGQPVSERNFEKIAHLSTLNSQEKKGSYYF